MPDWLDATSIINGLGSWAIWGAAAILLAECGLFVGFVLPGDSLLFTIGLLSHQGHIQQPIAVVCLVLTAGAFLGNALGYEIGRKAGPALFARPDSRVFKQQHLERAHQFFEQYGSRAIVLARFVPVVRTFITLTAGASNVPRRTFLVYSGVGAVIWATGVTLLGYALGGVALIREHIEVGLLLLVVLTLIPMGVEYVRGRRKS